MIGFYAAGAMNHGDAPVVNETGLVSFSTTDGTAIGLLDRLGWIFTPNQDITLIGLRAIYQGLTGLDSGEDLRVHRASDGVLMASGVAVPVVADVWREVSVAPVLLSSGVDYVVSGRAADGASRAIVRNNSFAYTPKINAPLSGSLFGAGTDMPTSVSGNTYRFMDIVFEA